MIPRKSAETRSYFGARSRSGSAGNNILGFAKNGQCAMALLDPDDGIGSGTGITVSGEEGKCTDITAGTGEIDIGFQTITLPCVDNDDDGYLE